MTEALLGKQFVDIEITDIMSGEDKMLSEIVGKGKPVIVDFYTSW